MANKSIVAHKEEKVKALSDEIKGANLVSIVLGISFAKSANPPL